MNDQSETILLAVIGLSPAVLTETLWALAQEADPILPDRIVVITTSTGRALLEQKLFTPDPCLNDLCPWDALRQALAQSGHSLEKRLRFGATPSDICVFTATDPATGRSRELSDLRTPQDNEAAADFLLDQVRTVVENPDARLIASMAGGRKTMGALLYACLTLAGRETDRLTHVLVNEPYETLPGFWFPAQPGPPLKDRQGNLLSPLQAQVELADVPFVPLRNLFQRELGRPVGTFSRLVDACRATLRRRAAEDLQLTIDPTRHEIELGGRTLKLAPLEMLTLLFLGTRAKRGERAFNSYKDAQEELNSFREQQRDSRPTSIPSDWRHSEALRQICDDRTIIRSISDLRAKLRTFGDLGPLLAACLPEKGRCSLDIPGPAIFIKG